MSDNIRTIEIHQLGDRSVAIALPQVKAIGENPVGIGEGKPRSTQAPVPVESHQGYRWAPWGEDDMLPTRIRQKLNQVPMAGQAIYKLVQMMYGNGIAYYRNEDLRSGNTNIKRASIPAVDQFLRTNRIHTRYLPAQFADYRYYLNTFCEMILNVDKNQIVKIFHKSAEFCRLSKQNESTLNTDWLYYSPDFSIRPPSDDRIKRVPLFNVSNEEGFLDKLLGYKFAWHCCFPTPGQIYYARPYWIGLFKTNGWIDVSASVPEIVNAMMRNQVVLKYIINIPETYFEIRYVEWKSYTDAQRETYFTDLTTKLNNELSGTDNAYKSITNFFRQNPVSGDAIGKIEIVAIDDKLKRDAWVPSSNAADAQIVQTLGLHPSQLGLAPEGGKMGAGSGSDQRESYNTGITLNTIDQQIVLEPLNYIAEFNARTNPDWDITFFIDHTYHTTSNLMESGLAPSDTTLVID